MTNIYLLRGRKPRAGDGVDRLSPYELRKQDLQAEHQKLQRDRRRREEQDMLDHMLAKAGKIHRELLEAYTQGHYVSTDRDKIGDAQSDLVAWGCVRFDVDSRDHLVTERGKRLLLALWRKHGR